MNLPAPYLPGMLKVRVLAGCLALMVSALPIVAAEASIPLPEPRPSPLYLNPPKMTSSAREHALFSAVLRAIENDEKQKFDQLLPLISDPDLAKYVEWRLLRSPQSGRKFSEIKAFLDENPHWPGRASLATRLEEAMTDDLPDAEILDWFKRASPRTVDGAMRLIAAQLRAGATAAASEMIRRTWVEGDFGQKQLRTFYDRHQDQITAEDHWQRLDRLLWEGRFSPAHQMLRYVSPERQLLARARIALRRQQGGVDYAVRRVPADLQNDPGLIYERVRWRRVKDMDIGATELLTEAASTVPSGIRPRRWWTERAILVRRALDDGDITRAYRLARDHNQTSPAQVSDAEWLAGWIALRFLGEPETADAHFQNLYDVVSFPISKSRGAYWTGRAAEAIGDEQKAVHWYERAAVHIHTYYGQLAAEALDRPLPVPLDDGPVPSAEQSREFEERELVRLVRKLGELGLKTEMRILVLKLTDDAKDPLQLSLVMDLARENGRPDLMIFAAKRAQRAGQLDADAAYPVHPLVQRSGAAEAALVHSIMRQESLFNPDAISRVGARGLMQLMPATAQMMARELGLGHTTSMLLSDHGHNIRLGSHYIGKMIRQWNGSYVLAIASYNAGPGNVRRWVREYGDPRSEDVDVVDWIESIPFRETRNYVQRVLEGTTVYRARLGLNETASLSQTMKSPAGDR